ncbi:MAG TPA: hypothetical protein VIH49_05700 [Solirubrobacteraceae bacterium]|nr:hypothetical protein [Solirubrobacteraceae bacterium]
MSTDYTLAYGTHATPDDGRCAMEWVSHLAGEPHSDQPKCVSPALRAICIALNDGLEHEPRQRLRPYLTRTIGTAYDGLDEARSWMAMDWLIREYTPTWLAAAGLAEPAAELRSLPAVLDEPTLGAAIVPVGRARMRARGARGADRSAPWTAARTAARETAWACAGAAAWASARVSVVELEGERARAGARATAADAATVIARRALPDRRPHGRAGTKDATRAILAPIVYELRASVLALLERMLPTEPLVVPKRELPLTWERERIFTTSV